MNRIIRAAGCLVSTNAKFAWIKVTHFKRFKASPVSICSPFSEFSISGETKLGRGLKVYSGCHITVRKGAKLFIGDNVFFNHGDILVCRENIKIGNNVQFAPNVLIYDHDHDFRTKDGLKNKIFKTSPIEIGNNVWIGANTVILRGTRIGDNCVIAAGSVVKGDIPSETVLIQKRDNMLVSASGDR